ncbi:hypothetical protein JXL83_04635 [candidate division WOR-3 bacterium]|nr:hypothetical protein [candidate division WOR-3 bacterium]
MIEYAISSNAEEILAMLERFVKEHNFVEGMTIADKDGLSIVSYFHTESQEEILAAISPVIIKDLSSLPLGEIRYFIAMGKDAFAVVKPLDTQTFLSMFSQLDVWNGLMGQKDIITDFEILTAQLMRMGYKNEI